jgi:hypothetical protein
MKTDDENFERLAKPVELLFENNLEVGEFVKRMVNRIHAAYERDENVGFRDRFLWFPEFFLIHQLPFIYFRLRSVHCSSPTTAVPACPSAIRACIRLIAFSVCISRQKLMTLTAHSFSPTRANFTKVLVNFF